MTTTQLKMAIPGVGVALALLLVGCSSDDDGGGAATTAAVVVDDHADDGDDHGDESFAFGEPGDPAEADRTIEVDMLDSMAFDPDEFEIAAGETVTFEVTNTGDLEHDFTIGDVETQEEHDAEMREGGHMGDDPNAIAVAAGESGSITWTFTEPGDLEIGCHIPGHYAAGMVAEVTVTG